MSCSPLALHELEELDADLARRRAAAEARHIARRPGSTRVADRPSDEAPAVDLLRAVARVWASDAPDSAEGGQS